jgi:hypothetical protein
VNPLAADPSLSLSRPRGRTGEHSRTPGLGVHDWWTEPHFEQCFTAELRDEFVLGKLMQRDPRKFQKVLLEICQIAEPRPVRITPSQWQALLAAMGANLVEISEVLIRLGLTWQ